MKLLTLILVAHDVFTTKSTSVIELHHLKPHQHLIDPRKKSPISCQITKNTAACTTFAFAVGRLHLRFANRYSLVTVTTSEGTVRSTQKNSKHSREVSRKRQRRQSAGWYQMIHPLPLLIGCFGESTSADVKVRGTKKESQR